VPAFADRGCHVISVTDLYGRILGFLDQSESYRTIIKALAEKQAEFHTHKLKKERSYRIVLKNALLHQP
jgi:CBS-domain-containing membrane protein